MEDLQKAISILLNPAQNYSNEIKQQAAQICEQIINEHKTDYAFFFEILRINNDIYTQFWSLGALESIITRFYLTYDISLRRQLHDFYFLFLEQNSTIVFSNPLICQKFSLIFILVVKVDYPEQWPEAFTSLLKLPNLEICATSLQHKLHYIGIF